MPVFISTRNKKLTLSSKEAIIQGLSADGGLYIFDNIKPLNITKLKNHTYQEIAYEVLSNIFNDYTLQELKSCINEAYKIFSHPEITPLTKIGNNFLLELYHGPTSAFKDIALTILPHLLKKAHHNKKIYILTATSGDTGKAALEGFKNVENTFITVFYPKDKVSFIQEKQMLTTIGSNTDVVSVNGNFDDCQRMVKDIFSNIKNDSITLSSANSINIGRLIPQVVYYFKAYLDLWKQDIIVNQEKVNFIVPTGNFGNILAGYIAKLMGCPINKLVCASNKNNVLTDFINTGRYDCKRPFYQTISPSMDILVSSNLERLLFLLNKSNDSKIKDYMTALKNKKEYQIDNKLLNEIQIHFKAFFCNEDDTRLAIKEAYEKDNRLIDPHSAIAYHAAKNLKDNHKNIILATASPYKFAKDVYESITNEKCNETEALKKLFQLTHEDIPENLKLVLDKENLHHRNINLNQGFDYIEERIKNICLK